MRKLVVGVALVLVLLTGLAVGWQHTRYLGVRRDLLHDRQPMLYGPSAFHAAWFLAAPPGADLFEELRSLRAATEIDGAQWIYAGKAVLSPLVSAQIEPAEWTAVVILQFSSREDFDRIAQRAETRAALDGFDAAYVHGFERSAPLNLLIPQGLMMLRARDVLTGKPSNFPFEPAEAIDRATNRDPEVLAKRLLEEEALGKQAILVANLMKNGNGEQGQANQAYGLRMLAAMAEGGYGPMHMGNAVTVEGDAAFDRVAFVFYPGVRFFADMVRSEFFQAIIGDKQLADTQATITVPILDRL